MFDGTVLLYGVVTAVVVGENKSFGGDDFAGAAAAEDDYGVFHRGAVGIVDVVDVDEQSGFFSCSLFCCLRKGRSHMPSSAMAGERASVAASRVANLFLNFIRFRF